MAIAAYLPADRILLVIEHHLGRTLEQRLVVFFGVLRMFLLTTFAGIRYFFE